MDRKARLQSAVSFLRTVGGKDVARRYSRWFGVDLLCALRELEMLGMHIDPVEVDRLRACVRERERQAELRREQRRLAREEAERLAAWELEVFLAEFEPPGRCSACASERTIEGSAASPDGNPC